MIYKLSTDFKFGKFKGVKVQDVFTGVPPSKIFISQFINHVLLGIIKDLQMSGSIIEPPSFFDDGNSITFSGNPDSCAKALNSLIKKMSMVISRSLANLGRYSLAQFQCEQNNFGKMKLLTPISGNPDYIIWAIKNVSDFCIEEEDFLKLTELNILLYRSIYFNVESNRFIYGDVNYNKCKYSYSKLYELRELNSIKYKRELLDMEVSAMDDCSDSIEPFPERQRFHIPDSELDRGFCSICEQTPCMCSHPPWL